MKSTLLAFFLSIQILSIGQTEQRQCATYEANRLLKNRNPTYKNIIDDENRLNRYISAIRKQKKYSRIQEDTLIIPVIVHVIHNGDAVGVNENISQAQIMSQFEVLNEDFQKKPGTLGYNTQPAGIGMPIKFVPAAYDPEGNMLPECGIHRVNATRNSWDNLNDIETLLKPATIFDPKQYLNIWVVTFGGGLTTRLGYAQMPDFSSLSGIDMENESVNSDGLVIRFNVFGRTGNLYKAYNKGRTTTHEMGHFLGLLHIWGIDDNNANCLQDDGCDDTPKTAGPIYNCPASRNSCTVGLGAMIDNYMDYADDACMHTFTADQKDRIFAVLSNSPRRKELSNSEVYKIGMRLSVSASNPITNCNTINFSVSGANEYLWRANTITAIGNTFGIKPQSDLIVSVKGTSIYGCVNEIAYSLQLNTTTCASTATENTQTNEVFIFPNPFDEKLTIESYNTILEIKLLSSIGFELNTDIATFLPNKKLELQTTTIPKGLYFLKIHSKGGWGVWRIVK